MFTSKQSLHTIDEFSCIHYDFMSLFVTRLKWYHLRYSQFLITGKYKIKCVTYFHVNI